MTLADVGVGQHPGAAAAGRLRAARSAGVPGAGSAAIAVSQASIASSACAALAPSLERKIQREWRRGSTPSRTSRSCIATDQNDVWMSAMVALPEKSVYERRSMVGVHANPPSPDVIRPLA